MPAALQNLMEKIDARVLRERWLIFLTLLALVFLIWQFALQSHLDNTRKTLEREQAKITGEQQSLDKKFSELMLSMATDPALDKQRQIEAFKTKIAAVETQLAGLSQGLISAEQLPKVLQEIFARAAAIELLEVRTLPAQELQLDTPIASASATTTSPNATLNSNPGSNPNSTSNSTTAQQGAGVYKHSVVLRVRGSYPELVRLLQSIEALEWKFYWETLDYQVKNYPQADIMIQVFTLSSEEGLLGV